MTLSTSKHFTAAFAALFTAALFVGTSIAPAVNVYSSVAA